MGRARICTVILHVHSRARILHADTVGVSLSEKQLLNFELLEASIDHGTQTPWPGSKQPADQLSLAVYYQIWRIKCKVKNL